MNEDDLENDNLLALAFLMAVQGFIWLAIGLWAGWFLWGRP